MKVFIAGASGAVGKRLGPQLLARSHEVIAMTRSSRKVEALRVVGAEPVVADGLDREMVIHAVMRARPDIVIHQRTQLFKFGRDFGSIQQVSFRLYLRR